MDLGFERQDWVIADGGAPIEWHGLRARFIAAQACRRALGEAPAASAAAGSFAPRVARSVAAFDATPGINPNALADGKPAPGNAAGVAGVSTGDRG